MENGFVSVEIHSKSNHAGRKTTIPISPAPVQEHWQYDSPEYYVLKF
jgi:hypothetical protein